MKENKLTAKVNKLIGGWDYREYHIASNRELQRLDISMNGSVIEFADSLGEAKQKIDAMVERATAVMTPKRSLETDSAIEFVSKKGIKYLLTIKDGKIKAFTYNDGKKTYWSVTKEIEKFMEQYMEA